MRKERIWYPGAMYHVMNRGARHEDIFRRSRDYEYFTVLLNSAVAKTDCKLHAYCLMPNHYHLLLETGNIPIWNIMKPISQHYTEQFNWRYRTDGAVFRGRYHTVLITNMMQYYETMKYISNNPVKAGLTATPSDYPWSSFAAGHQLPPTDTLPDCFQLCS